MKQRARKRSFLSVAITVSFIVISISGLLWIVYGDKGILHAYRLKMELLKVNGDNERLRKENEALLLEIEALKNDRRYIEKTAREELGMAKEGEFIFVFAQGGKSLTPVTVRQRELPASPGSAP